MKLFYVSLILFFFTQQIAFAECTNQLSNKDVIIANFGLKDATIYILQSTLKCPEIDSVDPNLTVKAPLTGNTILPIISLPVGKYDLCVEFSNKNKVVGDATLDQYRHQTIQDFQVKETTELQFITISPGDEDIESPSASGPCNFKGIAGNWTGSTIPATISTQCISKTVSIDIDSTGLITGTAVNSGTTQALNIKGKVTKLGKIKKGVFVSNKKSSATFSGDIDIVEGVGAGIYRELKSKCQGSISIKKVQPK